MFNHSVVTIYQPTIMISSATSPLNLQLYDTHMEISWLPESNIPAGNVTRLLSDRSLCVCREDEIGPRGEDRSVTRFCCCIRYMNRPPCLVGGSIVNRDSGRFMQHVTVYSRCAASRHHTAWSIAVTGPVFTTRSLYLQQQRV